MESDTLEPIPCCKQSEWLLPTETRTASPEQFTSQGAGQVKRADQGPTGRTEVDSPLMIFSSQGKTFHIGGVGGSVCQCSFAITTSHSRILVGIGLGKAEALGLDDLSCWLKVGPRALTLNVAWGGAGVKIAAASRNAGTSVRVRSPLERFKTHTYPERRGGNTVLLRPCWANLSPSQRNDHACPSPALSSNTPVTVQVCPAHTVRQTSLVQDSTMSSRPAASPMMHNRKPSRTGSSLALQSEARERQVSQRRGHLSAAPGDGGHTRVPVLWLSLCSLLRRSSGE